MQILMLSPSYIISNSVALDEVAHDEPPHQDLRCLQIQLFASLVLKELRHIESKFCPKCMKVYKRLNKKFPVTSCNLHDFQSISSLVPSLN